MSETVEPPPEEPAAPKRLSFREANLGPEPKPSEPPPRPHGFFATRKRTVTISLVTIGAAAAAVYGVTQLKSDCGQNSSSQWTSGQPTPCSQSGGGSGWHGGYGFSYGFGGSTADASTASRGGFGSTGSAHGGGGE